MGDVQNRADRGDFALTERQRVVMHAVVTSYLADAAPVGSTTLSHSLSVRLSSASIRNTMAELGELGFLETPHTSAGRVPTSSGLRFFVDHLLPPGELGSYERRHIDNSFELAELAGSDGVVSFVSRLLSEQTRQLGFVVAPRVERMTLRHVSLVRLSNERVLVVLVSQSGQAHRRVVVDPGSGDQRELEKIARELNGRIVGSTLEEIRDSLADELAALQEQASRFQLRALSLGLRVIEAECSDASEIIIATRLALLDQPEFGDRDTLRDLFGAVEARERLVELLDNVIADAGASVALGDDLVESGLDRCGLVAAPYGEGSNPLGVLGVIGPRRMDYAHVIPLVSYCSSFVTQKLSA
jgi:heat-inducible transcriptional repressor